MSGTWSFVGAALGVILLVIWVLTLVDIFRRRLGAGPTAGWVIIVLLLPFLGAVIYWARREPSRGEVEYQASAERARREAHRSQPFDSTFER
jgi:FtsH-binding integral membrane protein